ncbi:hypothetical protein A2841_02800 [Candidatus Kaiserbacteria bacterium RIFCSPHIGHO2_01_FULL_48_10]|uniref:Rod shape-determining protein MreD n=1 Tax=Candidatus Kaiserbacteria bacterium RIFCSPHIGHO2_01_FULL_48_10 TaxID=1798476 RepID=A0A1F6C5E1_9BACT|nr:MAG: hypothetical protein A2841_02800 [Candidatus Kaiserbacteria bacterium RIFCSPHIGHO2_01_FULL_48_10]
MTTGRIVRVILVPFFFASVIVGPWWISVMLGILVVSTCRQYLPVIAGGILMDTLFGAPIPVLLGFDFLYTAVFSILAAGAFFLRARILE